MKNSDKAYVQAYGANQIVVACDVSDNPVAPSGAM
jgi:hypothetical protein